MGYAGFNHIYLNNADTDIIQISLCLRHTGASQLKEIYLDGEQAARAQRLVSVASMRSMYDVIRDQATRLEVIKLFNLVIDDIGLIGVVETCRTISTMREIELVYIIVFWQACLF